jgi:hypothetical protein
MQCSREREEDELRFYLNLKRRIVFKMLRTSAFDFTAKSILQPNQKQGPLSCSPYFYLVTG